MSGNEPRFPIGETLDGGRFTFVELVEGYAAGLWRGIDADNRQVLITLGGYLSPGVRDAAQHGAPGIPRVLFIGDVDGQRYPDERHVGWQVIVQENLEGKPLSQLPPLGAVDVARIGTALCDLLLGWAKTGRMTLGLRPDTIFITGDDGQRRLAGAIPHSYLVIGQPSGVFPQLLLDAPNYVGGALDQAPEDVVYTLGLVLWRAATGSDAFDLGDGTPADENMWNDRRATFAGDPRLGAALERVLVFDINQRETAVQLRERLASITRP